ncbi:hypothetical protein GCM10022421_19170 [Oceanisphaera sediminis]|uniref:Uncharacterized protein n=2 Tax=Oceanisphaera sediminis TaxID=981381 RepID=A0ABP7E0M1_9GAMM
MRRITIFLMLSLTMLAAQASDVIKITEFRRAQINLFDPVSLERVKKVDTGTLELPLNILEVKPSGHYVVEIENERYSIKKRMVRTDRTYELNSSCKNVLAANLDAATRGLGNGECK